MHLQHPKGSLIFLYMYIIKVSAIWASIAIDYCCLL
jgi:hypothetical protein